MRRGWIAAGEAQQILGCHRSMLFKQIRCGNIPSARLFESAEVRRQYIMKRSDVVALQAKGFRLHKTPARRESLLWARYFGAVPKGFTPAFRDGDREHLAPSNLCLLPLKHKWREAARIAESGQKRRRHGNRFVWSPERLHMLRSEFPYKKTSDLAKEMGIGKATLTHKARQLGLRKDADALRAYTRGANALPVGTERVHYRGGHLAVKVSDTGTYRQQWQMKSRVVWEQANGRPIPPRYRIIFKDGDNRNFSPDNLIALSQGELSALVNIKNHVQLPPELRALKRLTNQARKEVARQIFGGANQQHTASRTNTKRRRLRVRAATTRWTPEMDDILRRDYPIKLRTEVATSLGVSESALRQRARRLGIQRLPETVLAEARAKARMAVVQSRSPKHPATSCLAA